MADDNPDSLLPLPPAVFHILIALADRDRHGYSIMQDVAARTDGKVRLSAGTLYSAIRRMLEQGLVAGVGERPAPPGGHPRARCPWPPPRAPARRRAPICRRPPPSSGGTPATAPARWGRPASGRER